MTGGATTQHNQNTPILEAERNLIGSMLWHGAHYIAECRQMGLYPEHMSWPLYGDCLRAIYDLSDEGKYTDIPSVVARLDRPDPSGITYELTNLHNDHVKSLQHVETVTKDHHRRRVRQTLDSALRMAADPRCDLDELDRLIATIPTKPAPDVSDVLERLGRINFTADFWNAVDVEELWSIYPLLPKGRGCSIFAPPGAGKSLMMLSFAVAKATGQGQDRGRVLYCDYEMTADDLRERLTDMGHGPHTDLSDLVYLSLPSLPPLNTREGGQALLSAARAAHAEVVVIDTFSRAVVGPENDAATAQDYYRHAGSPLKAAGFSVMRIDHTGKDTTQGARGSSAKRDDVDIAWSLTLCQLHDGSPGVTLKPDKRRLKWIPEEVTLRQHSEPLRYSYVNEPGWPEGTAALAATMDRLGLSPEMSSRAVIDALQASDVRRSKTVVLAAIRYRKSQSKSGSEPPV